VGHATLRACAFSELLGTAIDDGMNKPQVADRIDVHRRCQKREHNTLYFQVQSV